MMTNDEYIDLFIQLFPYFYRLTKWACAYKNIQICALTVINCT